ncbi:MoaD/ThiS family protein [Marinoscillum furvescens]|uniref:Molybdopterin synthase sulfur carrier subunit n=1 Tax=Marinoscillum furvescens DSM 4134 TaxID=1122208 RepID=A0A3D9LIC9_MARFU|nr:MoaD/ThiS family protein [Marinoscillum furvescens]REE05615.1 molybdopterin synthase sulfur carrier subunit [Marinoscillum furvescens DSM 4134]
MVRITMYYFGLIAEKAGVATEQLELLQGADVESVHQALQERYPSLQSDSYQVSVNRKICTNGPVSEGDEVAILPPFAGG